VATTIDALVVTLGLDASGFKKGQQQAGAALKETKGVVTSAVSEMSSSISGLALKFSALFLGIKGLEDVIGYFKDLHMEMVHLYYDSSNLGIAANELRDWAEVAKSAGGDASDAASSIQGLQSSIFNLRFRGQVSDQIEGLQRLGVNPIGPGGKMQDFKTLMFQLATALQKRLPDEASRYQYVTGYGIAQGGIANAIAQGPKALADFYNQAKSSTQVTQKQVSAQAELEKSLVHLQFAVSGAAAEILDNLTLRLKELTGLLTDVTVPLHFIVDTFKLSFGDKSSLAEAGNWLGGKAADIRDWFGSAQEKRARAALAGDFAAVEKDMGLPAGLLDRIATTESHYNPNQVGGKGEVGLFQLLPQFHSGAGQDPVIDAQMAAADLRDNFKKLGSWPAAIAAYNEGVTGYKRGAVPNGNAAYVDKVLGANPSALGAAAGAQPTPSISPPISRSGGSSGGVNVDIGTMHVNTQATDATSIAADMARAVQRKFLVFQADTGVVA
jgi:hypothetical protein